MTELLRLARGARVFDLSQPFFAGMPHYPTHPPFLFSLAKQHGDFVAPGGMSSATESFAFGGHVGTHIDAFCHISSDGKLHGGVSTARVQSYTGGLTHESIDTVGLVLRRGVLLDIAREQGVDTLPADFGVASEHLEAAAKKEDVSVEPGNVVLLRTGWARYWDDPPSYIADLRTPGPELEGARWLSDHGVFAAGSDTLAFEKIPAPSLPVHVHLLVESGIHIIEVLNLEELARARVYTFLFLAAPLRIRGATASPIRPFALVESA
jgi:kynurenine formamidase